jgi:N-methylhydantoinase B
LTIEAVLAVLSQALPKRAIAAYGRRAALNVAGRDESIDRFYVYVSFGTVAGAGAVYGFDGYQSACDMGTLGVVGKTDAEDEMARFPWDVIRCEYYADSHGAGKWRGSPGIIWEGINVGGDCMKNAGPMDGFVTQGLGEAGGSPTPLNNAYIVHDGKPEPLREPRGRAPIKHGDHYLLMAGGGGGVGPAVERDPEAVLWDVRNELVSIQMAKDVYRVAIDPEPLRINKEETERLRASASMLAPA